jgi:hypothetical protein
MEEVLVTFEKLRPALIPIWPKDRNGMANKRIMIIFFIVLIFGF